MANKPAPPNLDQRERDAKRVLVDAAATASGGLAFGALADAMQDGSTADGLDWDEFSHNLEVGFAAVLVGEYEHIAIVTAHDVRTAAVRGAPFDPTRLSREWAADHVGELVTNITDSSRTAVKDIITEALARGYSIPRTAGRIRDVVGLHPRYAQAVERYATMLEGQGHSGARVEALAGRYADKLLNTRSEAIARYEVQSARNAGRIGAWREDAANGNIGNDSTKTWLAADGACPECVDLDGETVGMNDVFSTGDDMPPAHVSCRCTATIEVTDAQGAQVEVEVPEEE